MITQEENTSRLGSYYSPMRPIRQVNARSDVSRHFPLANRRWVLLSTPDGRVLLAGGIGVSVLEGRSDEIYPTPSTEVIGPFGSQP